MGEGVSQGLLLKAVFKWMSFVAEYAVGPEILQECKPACFSYFREVYNHKVRHMPSLRLIPSFNQPQTPNPAPVTLHHCPLFIIIPVLIPFPWGGGGLVAEVA